MSQINYDAIKSELQDVELFLENTKVSCRLNREELAAVKGKLWEIIQNIDQQLYIRS